MKKVKMVVAKTLKELKQDPMVDIDDFEISLKKEYQYPDDYTCCFRGSTAIINEGMHKHLGTILGKASELTWTNCNYCIEDADGMHWYPWMVKIVKVNLCKG